MIPPAWTAMESGGDPEKVQRLRITGLGWAAGEHRSAHSRPYVIALLAAILILGVALAYDLLNPNVPTVTVTTATTKTAPRSNIILTAEGYIVPHHRINVNPKVTGRVAWIGVEKGDKVRQGQVLVRLEDDEFRALYEQAQGAVASAQAYVEELKHGSRPDEIQEAEHNLDQARVVMQEDKLTLDRTRHLAAQGVLAAQALDDATARYDADEQRVSSLENLFDLTRSGPRPEEIARAEGSLSQAEGQEAYAKSMLDATVIRAPVSGTILERTAEKGELVTAQFASGAEGGPQGEVVALANLRDIQVELDISQSKFAKLKLDQKALITLDAFPDRKYKGIMAEVSPEANRQKGTIQVRVQILNPDGYLRPEMNALVRFLTDKNNAMGPLPSGIFVPSGAMHGEGEKRFVRVVVDGRVSRREVQIVAAQGNGMLVTGLSAGERIIVSGADGLPDGTKVRMGAAKGH